ncbi:MAG: aromatic ring-hydroxylating dioxygenase subunit alpha [Leptolyngbyaceae bacterium]|nr:aromatic ring-hydroxylating dioxygenase subunit alpha [Leptolyngbyaceae bacterium]
MTFKDFWYIVALSTQLTEKTVLSRTILNEWLAIFRGEDGKPVALRDRCMHRNSRLSTGSVCKGHLQCPYHGWTYNDEGHVTAVPSEGDHCAHLPTRQALRYDTLEQDGYIYVRLTSPSPHTSIALSPFPMPHYQEKGWATVRVINCFQNTVTNCAENFIDIPHTVYVHPGIFRSIRKQPLEMTVERRNGSVIVNYQNETNNLGWFSQFLNGDRHEIYHTDSFHMPNVTSVEYDMGPHRKLIITSQSVPETEISTRVYTDVTYNYGIWNLFARPFVGWTAQRIIQQDIEILATQNEVIQKYGQEFSHTPSDTIHIFVESIRNCLENDGDPYQLSNKQTHIKFWV